MKHRFVALAFLVVALPGHARADSLPELPQWDYAIGPSLAYVSAPERDSGFAYGIDGALAYRWFWGGGGMRAFENLRLSERALSSYVEAGFWCILNVGGGYTVDLTRRSTDLSGPHLFVGFPWGVTMLGKGESEQFFFVEPYYRPMFLFPGVLHEAGVLLKLTGWSGK